MKKIYFLTIVLISMALFSNAQTLLLQEGFENGIPSTWSNFDADGDGFSWTIFDWEEDGYEPHTGNACVTSASYDFDEEEALTPNNYLVTPAITIPSNLTIENNVALWWWVAAQDPEFPADHYEIFISTTGNTVADFTSQAVYTETISTDVWLQRYLDLTPYVGQTIYIAFVHNNCEDEFVMKLDDIEVSYFTEPAIITSVDELDFGYVVVGETTHNQSFTIQSALLDESLTLMATPPFEISPCGSAFAQQITVSANSFTTVYVRYSPTSVGTDVGRVDITSSGLTVSVNLRGIGVVCDAMSLPFYEDFEAELTPCWINSDFDADGMSWMWLDDGYGHASDGYYLSLSYDEEAWEDIMPNDWLITPQLAIPANGAYLSWWAAAYAEDYPENTYDVLISTTGTGPGDFTSLFTETMTTETYQQRSLDLSAYAGQNIHIAFAHHTNTEETEDSYGLVIDDISVEEGTGISDNVVENTVLVYPNPVRDVLNIKSVNSCDIVIYNFLGQIVYHEKATDDEIQIDTHLYAAGTYFVQVNGEKNCVKRFVVR